MSSSLRKTAVSTIFLLQVIGMTHSSEETGITHKKCCEEAFQNNSTQLTRFLRNAETGRGMDDAHDLDKPKSKPWLGYYDFLITEGSYKFWVVFELFTIAILIYSAFAAVYYAKYTINDYESYDDYFFGRNSRSVPSSQTAFLGLPVETYVRIFEAVADFGNRFS